MSKVGVGLIGCGGMGNALADGMIKTGLGSFVAVYDPVTEKAETTAAKLEAAAAKSEEALLAMSEVEAVIIATPCNIHIQNMLRAAAAGKNTFVEKPMTTSTADCDRANKAYKDAGKSLMVGHVLRYYEPFQTVIALTKSGVFGKPLHGAVWRTCDGGYIWSAKWRETIEESGGFLYEVGVHELDFIRQLYGDAVSVSAVLRKDQPSKHEIEDSVAVQMQFADNVSGSYLAGTGYKVGSNGFALHFEKAVLSSDCGFDPERLSIQVSKDCDFETASLKIEQVDAVQEEMRLWLTALTEGKPMPVTGEDSRDSVAIAEAAYVSAKTGRVVEVKPL
jgi:predicted dehydrogenase